MIEQGPVQVLKHQHKKLEAQLEIENTRPHPDGNLVNTIKRQKLRIKDELASMDAL